MKTIRIMAILLVAFTMLFSFASCSKGAAKAETNATHTQATSAGASDAEYENLPNAPAPDAGSSKELTIEEKLIADQWCYGYSVEGYGEFKFFFRFYENDPVLGSVYYAGMSNNRINFAGTYKLIERDYEYGAYKTREEEQADKEPYRGIAKYTVVLYDWDGNVTGRIGFDGERLINAQDKKTAKIYSTGSTPFFYERNSGSFDSTVAGEVPQVVFEYTAIEDETSVIQINHNHTYTDLVASMVEGTWTVSENAGELTFALEPKDKSDTPATLVVAADKQTATYTAEGSDSVVMGIPVPEVIVTATMEGKTPTSYGVEATLTANLMSDGTFTLIASVAGREMEFDKGTYTVEGGYKYTLNCEKAGVLKSEVVDRSVQLAYKQAGTKLGDVESILTVKK